MKYIWVFHGANARFTSGVFSTKATADQWIKKHKLTGLLTCYPLDTGCYDWAIESNFFEPKNESQITSEFIQKFTTASQEHYHYENGDDD